MNLLSRARAGLAVFRGKAAPTSLVGVDDNRGWSLMGRWGQDPSWFQRDIQVNHNAVLANWAIFSCTTLIASDIGKVALRLVELLDGIWRESEGSAAFSPVLRKPNRYQTRQQFIEAWLVSKLTHGNTYVLKERDNRGVVIRLYVLDPTQVRPLVAPDGSVYYELGEDNLSGVTEHQIAVPASEVIHDRFNCLFHPLVGLSPIFASGLAAMQGLHIQQNSAKFFRNMSQPGGVLTAPAKITDETAKRIKDYWEREYSGEKVGRVAVLSDGLSYTAMGVNPVDAQMAEQMKATAEMICSTFHVPAFKIGAGTIPAGQKVEDLNQIYYSDCLHALMDAIQTLLREGLGLEEPKQGRVYGVAFDLDDLLKMDSSTFSTVLKLQVGAGIKKLDEARRQLNLPPMEGGNAAYLQVQNYSVAALAKRDAQPDPFGKTLPPAPPAVELVAEPAPPPKELLELAIKAADNSALMRELLAEVQGMKQAAAEKLSQDNEARELAAKAAGTDELVRDLLAEVRGLKQASEAAAQRSADLEMEEAAALAADAEAERQVRELCEALKMKATEAIHARQA